MIKKHKIHIAHLTSAHERNSSRIFYKMCLSCIKNNLKTSFIVSDGMGNDNYQGVNIYSVRKIKNRFARILLTPFLILYKSLKTPAEIYHLHDPELIPIGLILKLFRKKVIFDSHEDIPTQMLAKPYLNKISLKFISKLFCLFQRVSFPIFDGIITATPYIENLLRKHNKNLISIANFPIIETSACSIFLPSINQSKAICYVGGISENRGIYEIIQALSLVNEEITLNLCGNFQNKELKEKLSAQLIWNRVNYLGFVDQQQIKEVFKDSFAGIVTLHPIKNYQDSLPIKLFEYMNAGLPIIASNFNLWKSIIEEANDGLLVDPLNSKEIANAIDFLYRNKEIASEMGFNGQRKVHKKYNWNFEEKKLITFYRKIIDS